MGISTLVKRLVGGETRPNDGEDSRGEPSHVCASCGEEYFTNADANIATCRNCGGIKVERA